MPIELTGVIIARNEELDLPQCLSSWRGLCSRVVMVDDASTDATPEIAMAFGCDVIKAEMTEEYGYSGLRNLGLEQVDTSMALVFDADERPTSCLAAVIQDVSPRDGQAFRMLRRTNVFGGWLDHGRFGGDAQVRMFPSSVRYSGLVHETPELPPNTEIITLDGYVEHFTYRTIGEYISKMRRYAELQTAELQAQDGPIPTLRYTVMQPAHNFIKERGYRDGWRGALMALGDGWYNSMIMRDHANLNGHTLPDQPKKAG